MAESETPRPRGIWVLTALLVVLTIAGAVHYWIMRGHAQSLRQEAEAKMREVAAFEPAREQQLAHTLVVTRDYLVWGPVRGKVSVFSQPAQQTPGTPPRISGYEFYYSWRENAWHMTESGHCSGKACMREATKALAKYN